MYSKLYKPGSMFSGGGRGNGRSFDMAEFAGRMGVFRSSESSVMTADAEGSNTWRMLAICAAVPATGILFAWKFKGRY